MTNQDWDFLKTKNVWALIPELVFMKETEKAILFEKADSLTSVIWIPKSQIHLELWAFSKCFTPIAQWCAKEKGLLSGFYQVGTYFDKEEIRKKEALYFASKSLTEQTREQTGIEKLTRIGEQDNSRSSPNSTSTDSLIKSLKARFEKEEPNRLPRNEIERKEKFEAKVKRGRAMQLNWSPEEEREKNNE